MSAFPTSPRAAFLTWCQSHADTFAEHFAEIGMSESQSDAFKVAVEAAVAAENARYNAVQTARSLTLDASQKATELRTLARAAVGTIKSFAMATNDEHVYVIADIPAPQPPQTLPPPGQPTDVLVGLDPTSGAIELRWKCVNPPGGGTAYIVRRRIVPGGAFEFVGVTGERRFVDSTFNAGPDRVEYTIQGQRADKAGPVSLIVAVNFGVPVGPGMAPSMTFTTRENTEGAEMAPARRAA